MQTATLNAIPARRATLQRGIETTSERGDHLWTLAGMTLGLLSGGITGLGGILMWCGLSAATLSSPGPIPLIVGGVIAPGLGAFAVFLGVAASRASSASR